MPGLLKNFSRGDAIIAEGSVGKSLYIVGAGKVEVFKNSPSGPVQLAILGPNEVFGEMSLIDDRFSRRAASVRALERSEIIILDREGFDGYMKQASPGIHNLVKRLAKRLRETNDIISKSGLDPENLPKTVKLSGAEEDKLSKLTLDQMSEAVDAAVDLNLLPKKFKKGQVLIKENAEAMSLFLLREGSVKVYKSVGGEPVELDTLCANEVFGEISMFDEGKRFFTVRAIEDGEAVVFSKKQMDEMLRKAPLELYLILECLTQKLKRMSTLAIEQMVNYKKLESSGASSQKRINTLEQENTQLKSRVAKLEAQQKKQAAAAPQAGTTPQT